MSQENIEVVRAMNEAYESGEIERSLEYLDPEVEWRGTVGGVEEKHVVRGRDEVVAAFIESLATWERLSLDYVRYIDAGDQVVVFIHEIARGVESGVELESETAMIYTVAGGKVTHARGYMDREAALAVAGVSG